MIKKITKQIVALLLVVASQMLFGQCSLREVKLADRVNASDLVIEGKVVAGESYWDVNHRMIYTMSTVEVYKVFKGSVTTTSINIITEGGTVGFDRVSASPGLELHIGDVGVFANISNKLPVSTYQNNIYPHYNTYASVQGFIKYDQISAQASDAFSVYSNIDKQLYQAIYAQTEQAYKVVRPFSVSSYFNSGAKLMSGPSITSFSPATITAGTKSQLTINGSGFGSSRGTGTVGFKNADDGGATYINPLATHYISWTDNQIVVEVPRQAGTGTVTVTQGSTATSGSSLTISYSELNVTYLSSALKTRHASLNGTGGYTWQMNTAFDANASAKASFIRALDTWRCNTGINWTIGATTSVDVHSSTGGVNLVTFDDNDALSAGVLGVCYSSWTSCDGIDWYVNDLDIVFDNGSNLGAFTWQYGPSLPTGSQYDFESVAVHELGHGHQLGHVINAGAVMHYALSNGASNRSPAPTDLSAANDVQSRSTANNTCGSKMTSYSGCSSPPVAAFTANKTSVCVGGSINFTDQSTNSPTSWAWTFSGGTPPTSTSQNPSVTYSTAGTYNVSLTATNSNGGDTKTTTGYITVTLNPAATSSVTTVSCNGGNNGSASVSASSGTAPYTYLWSTTATAVTITNLSAATYTCTVTDNKGCTVTTSGVVIQPTALSLTLSPSNTTTCGGSDGSITSSPSGGTVAYTYAWQNSSTAASISGLIAGTYSLTVTDSKGCTKSSSAAVSNTGCGSTQLSSGSCGITLPSIYQNISCDPVPNATWYEFLFVNAATGFSQTVQMTTPNTSTYYVNGIKYGMTYTVTVRVYISNSWGSYGSSCTITTPTIASITTTQLSSGSCGITLSAIYQNISCDAVPYATFYEFMFVNVATGFSQSVLSTSATLSTYYVSGIKYGLTYAVTVRSCVSNTWSNYGSSCTITTPTSASITATQLSSGSCGITLPSIYQNVSCDAVPNATWYEFLFVNAATGFSQAVQMTTPNISTYYINGIKYGMTYTVTVRAYVSNSWGSYSSSCAITTPTVASMTATQLSSGSCGITLSSLYQNISCDAVPYATFYEFMFVNSATGFSRTVLMTTPSTSTYYVNGIKNGMTYTVTVRSCVSNTWSSYGPSCTITTPVSGMSKSHFTKNSFGSVITNNSLQDIITYPNPISMNNILSIDIRNMMGDIPEGQLKIYNILGGEIISQKVASSELLEVAIDERFTSGIYFIEIIAGNNKQNKRIVVQ
jgi:PKD repeat protein